MQKTIAFFLEDNISMTHQEECYLNEPMNPWISLTAVVFLSLQKTVSWLEQSHSATWTWTWRHLLASDPLCWRSKTCRLCSTRFVKMHLSGLCSVNAL